MKKLLVQAIRDAVRCLSDRMDLLKCKAMNAAERGQEVRFGVLMSRLDDLAGELAQIVDAGSRLGMTKAELRPEGVA